MNKSQIWEAQGEVTLTDLGDPGTGHILPAKGVYGSISLVIGSGAETNTLADPDHPGQMLYIVAYTVGGGTRAITAATAVNAAGNTIMTFNAVRDTLLLVAVPYASNTARCRWEVILADSVSLS